MTGPEKLAGPHSISASCNAEVNIMSDLACSLQNYGAFWRQMSAQYIDCIWTQLWNIERNQVTQCMALCSS